MPRVDVTLNGRTYPVHCAEGEEPRLTRLGALVNRRLTEITANAGGNVVGESQLLAIAALMLADEVVELTDALAAARAEASATPAAGSDDAGMVAAVDRLTERLDDIAERLERT